MQQSHETVTERYVLVSPLGTIGLRLLGVLVEQTRVTHAALDGRHVGRVNVLLLQTLPRDLCEPRVLHNILAATVQITQPFGQILCDELREQVLGVRVDVRRVLDAA